MSQLSPPDRKYSNPGTLVGASLFVAVLSCLVILPALAQEQLLHAWEVGVEVEVTTNLWVYDGDGSLLVDASISQNSAFPDWTVDLHSDSSCGDCDWYFDWENEDTDLLTFKFTGDGFAKTYVFVPSSVRTQSTFWSPADNIGSWDIIFRVLDESGGPAVKADGGGTDPPFFEDVFAGNYVIPYDEEYFCTQASCSFDWAYETEFFLSPVDYIPNSTTRTFTFAPEANSEYHESWNAEWDVPNLKLEFHPQRKFLVKGDLDATGVTFTSEDPTPNASTGWGGISFEVGSSGTLENSVIEGVGGYGGYSLRITNASPTIEDVTIDGAAGYGIGGISVTGSTANPHLEGNRILNTSGSGVSFSSSAGLRLVQNTIEDNDGWGIMAGFSTRLYLSPPFGSTPGVGSFGNVVEDNDDGGIGATMSAYLTFGWYDYQSGGGYHVDGYNSVVGNGGIGLSTTLTGGMQAGSTTVNKMNRIFNNATNDAVAHGSGSRVYARCDWWNDVTPPFRTSELSGGLVYDDYYLLEDPYVDTDATCTSGGSLMLRSAVNRSAGTSSEAVAGASPRELFIAAVEIAGSSPSSAVSMFSQIVADGGDEEVVYAALAELGLLISRHDVTEEAHELGEQVLQAAAKLNHKGRRSAALRALVMVYDRRGETRNAFAVAETLVAEAASAEDVLFGQVALAHLHAGGDRPVDALNALAEVEQLSPGSLEAMTTRDAFGARFGVDSNELVDTSGKSEVHARVDELELLDDRSELSASFELLPAFPNPANGQVTVQFTLKESAQVVMGLYDVLGRRVAALANRRFESGFRSVAFDAGTLPVGTYLLRATASSDEAKTYVLTRAVSVVR